MRDAAEQAANQRWAEWHTTASELAAQHEAVDLPLERAKAELARPRRPVSGLTVTTGSVQGRYRTGPATGDARRSAWTRPGRPPPDHSDGRRRLPVQPVRRPARAGRRGDRR